MTYKISIQLDEREFDALRSVAQVQLRHPRDQVRIILRSVLLGEPDAPVQKNSESAHVCETAGAFAHQ